MPITPKPFVCKCADCGWQETYSPVSDVLLTAPPDACPKCGSQQIETHSATLVDQLGLWLKGVLVSNRENKS